MIKDIYKDFGKKNDITILLEEGRQENTYYVLKEGIEIDKGYVSSGFVTQRDKMLCVIDDAYVLLTDKKIKTLSDISCFVAFPYTDYYFLLLLCLLGFLLYAKR